jgi:trehalose synthase
MTVITEVPIGSLDPERFEDVLDRERYTTFQAAIQRAQDVFEGRIVWNVNSTARGGGVAELLRSLLAYAHGAGVDARWAVIDGAPEFFTVTKRIHNNLHGAPGDGGELDSRELEIYASVMNRNADELTSLFRSDDVVILHDPQTAGLCVPSKEAAGAVIWRCHVGLDTPNEHARRAWDFLRPMVSPADRYVFSRRAFAWEELEDEKIVVIPPSIDAFSPKNQDLDPGTVQSILASAGLIDAAPEGPATFLREDGSPGTVVRTATFHDGGAPPPENVPLVVQVSRWDRLKDPVGVIEGFARYVAPHTDAHLVMAGPDVYAVDDDPEGAEVLNESLALWETVHESARARIHLVLLPMDDGEENAAMVNALQRRAAVVVQKSLAEGFGLTVSEGMWKARPVVASKVGGIQEQIIHGRTGLLLSDARDLQSFGGLVTGLLKEPRRAAAIGAEAQGRIRDEFLGPRHLMQYLDLISGLVGA